LAERITITDGALTVELQRWLQVTLYGNDKVPGLYSHVAHGVQSWDAYQNMIGQIRAYEAVLQRMNEIANQQGSSLEEKVILSKVEWPRMN